MPRTEGSIGDPAGGGRPQTRTDEGYAPFLGHRVWYRRVEPERASGAPLLVVHGGPSIPHDYLEPLEALADQRAVIFYDQLGCGRSDRPDDRSRWHVGTFVDEIDAVREALGLEQVHLLGHSMGGSLLLVYALRRPAGVASLVLASAVPSITQFLDESLAQLRAISPEAPDILLRHEAAGTTDDPEYRAIFDPWLERHMIKRPLAEWPEPLNRAFAGMGTDVYGVMWGGGQFSPKGNLLDFDVRDRLHEIDIPTLIVHGGDDYVVPAIGETLRDGIPGSRLTVVEGGSHLPWFDTPEAWFAIVRDFLLECDTAAAAGPGRPGATG